MAIAKLVIEDVMESLLAGERTGIKAVAQKSKHFRDASKLLMENITPEQWKLDVADIVDTFADDDLKMKFVTLHLDQAQVENIIDEVFKNKK